jgi:NAD(P)-dependent dehydrogenase (short-subunit alcohol dehydrogenase family)
MTDRCILVTGSSRGIGAGLVRHYLEQEDRVAGCARGAASIDYERYLHLSTDVADEAGVRAAFRELRMRWGRLDAIINNAGIARMNPMALTPFDTARQIIETNFLGTFLCTHAATRLLRHSTAGRLGSVERLGLSDHVTVHSHQPDKVFLSGQQLRLEPMQRRCQRRTAIPHLRRPDQAKRWIGREARRVVEVFVARQAAIYGLPEQIRHAELRVQSLS